MTKRKPQAEVSARLSANGVKGRQASPWNRGPMCDTPGGKMAHVRYRAAGKRAEAGSA